MRHDKETIKITVIETSTILRLGLVVAIKHAVDCDVDFQEVSNVQDFAAIQDFNPDIIITNPLYCGFFNIKTLKQYFVEKNSEQTHFVALMVGPVDPALLVFYEAQINLYDDPDDIHLMIDKLMGYDKHAVSGDDLSEREKEIIRLVVKGRSNKEIAQEMNISVYTVLTHRRNVAKKLQIHSATAMTIYAISNKLVTMNEVKNL